MIIFGVKTTESTVSTGAFSCPRCRGQQGYRGLAYKRWFTLYFIPLIPLGRVGEQIECQGCFSRFSPDVLFAGKGDEPLEAIVVDEPASSQAASPPSNRDAPKTSPLAAASLILGVLSPVFLCACGLSLFTSLGAVVAGHWALLTMKRSPGRLGGQGLAIAGDGELLAAIPGSAGQTLTVARLPEEP